MKKLLSLVMMLVMMLAITPQSFEALAITKNDLKEAKKNAKELKKAGWIVQGPGNLETMLIKIYDEKANGNVVIIGEANGKRLLKVAKRSAFQDAMQKYAELTGNNTDIVSKQDTDGRIVVRSMDINSKNNNLQPYMTLVKETNGDYDCMIYFLVPNEELSKSKTD